MRKSVWFAALLLLILFVFVPNGEVKANPGVISEPGFETVGNWAYGSTDGEYAGTQSTTWKTEGSYSYQFSSTGTITRDAYTQISQSINFSVLDNIYFDAYLDQEVAGIFTASVLVGSIEVWSQVIPTTATAYLNQRIDVSGYSGSQSLIFRITNTSGGNSNKDQMNYFDNIRTWSSFSDVAHTVRCNLFSNPTTEHIAYMFGEGYPVQSYRVIFWNQVSSVWVSQDSQPVDAVGGSLSFGHTFFSGDGLWSAAVYSSVDYNPTTFDENDSYLVVWDSFQSQTSAIPEFPTIISGIVATGLCFAVYCLMRRRLAYVKV